MRKRLRRRVRTTDSNHTKWVTEITAIETQEAFEALVSRYEQSLWGLIYSYVGEYREAQNVLQQVWLQLYLSLATLRQNGRIKPQRAILALPHSYRPVVLLSSSEHLTFTPDGTSPQHATFDSQNPIPSSQTIPTRSLSMRKMKQYKQDDHYLYNRDQASLDVLT